MKVNEDPCCPRFGFAYLLFAALTVLASSASAATYLVKRVNDSGPSTLRDAIERANASPGMDLISFRINTPAPFVIAPRSPLPAITEALIIDGRTQPGYSGAPLIQIDGSGAGAAANGLNIRAPFVTVRALSIYSFSANGIDLNTSGNNIFGNYLGLTPAGVARGNRIGLNISGPAQFNFIGGFGDVQDRNVISANRHAGIVLSGAAVTENEIHGNYIGTDASGTAARPNAAGIDIFGAVNNLIGGVVPGAGNLISGSDGTTDPPFVRGGGIVIQSAGRSNRIEGNFIGTDLTGTRAIPNNVGILCAGAYYNRIGSDDPAARNLISGNRQFGIHLGGGLGAVSHSNVVQGNIIGPDFTGFRGLSNGLDGIHLSYQPIGNLIGGTNSTSEPNIIAYNGGRGIFLNGGGGADAGNPCWGNQIFLNRLLGIDIAPTGPNDPNDFMDVDTGPNGMQNFPVITFAESIGFTTLVKGRLHSRPFRPYRLEFFLSSACDLFNHGEGQIFLGFTYITTDALGDAEIETTLDASSFKGWVLTATATDDENHTSEFSICALVQ